MHRATSTFVIHNVELLVQESVESQLPVSHTSVQEVKYFFIHVVHHLLVLGNLEELSNLLVGLVILIAEVHLQFLLQFLVSFILFKSPRFDISLLVSLSFVSCIQLLIFLEECCFFRFNSSFFNSFDFFECFMSSLLFVHFLLVHVQIAKIDRAMTIIMRLKLLGHLLATEGFLRRNLLLTGRQGLWLLLLG